MDGKLKASWFVIGLCLVVTFLLYIAADKAVLDIEENGCEMTYMYEYPKYIKVNIKKKLSRRYPRYGLYIYGEGSYADELRRSKPTGIPVLFIPGNAGSHKQVRSLASVALRKSETHPNNFNYFTVDFDEDLGGLYGGVLMDQANFVYSCLRHILRMYEGNKRPPDSVVIIGHSMGGLISRALYLLDGFQPKLVNFILTLGTPHVEPVIPLDIQLTSVYSQVNNFWHSSPVVNNVTILSFAGGSRDILVPSKLSALNYISSSVLQYSSVTTSVPHVWLTTDHLALCWCKQLVLVINRVLFDMIDKKTNQITKRGIVQNKALKKHFGYYKEESNGGKTGYGENQKLPSVYNLTVLDADKQHMVSVFETILIPIAPDKNNAHFLALTNSDIDFQIKTCTKVQNETCMGFMDLSFRSLPTASGKVKFIDLSANTLAKFSHIMISSLKHKSLVSLMALQFTSKTNIDKVFNDFNMFSSSQTFVDTGALFINVSLPMVRYSFDVLLITVKKINCENANSDLLKGRVHVPWFDEDIYAYSADHSQELYILLKLHASKPVTALESAQLHIWNIDKCSFEVTIQQQFAHTLGQLFKMYAVEIPQWVYFWITTILTLQLSKMSYKGVWSSTWSTVTSNKLLNIIPLLLFIASEAPTKILRMFLLGETSSFWPYDWLLPKFFVILSALAALVFISFVLELAISSSAWLLLCCSPKLGKPQRENGISSLILFSIFFVLVLFFLSLFCSSVAIYLLTFRTYIYCCKKTKENKHLEENTDSTQPTLANHCNFSKTILHFLVMLSFQISPAFIVWLKVLPFSWSLPSDPYPFLVVVLAPAVICSIQMDLTIPPKYSSWIILSIWCVGFLFSSLAQLPYLIGVILIITDLFVLCKRKIHIKSC